MRAWHYLLLAAALAAVTGFAAQAEPAGPTPVPATTALPAAKEATGQPEAAKGSRKGAGLTVVAVTGVRLNWFDPSELDEPGERQAADPEDRPSYTIAMAGKFVGPVHALLGGVLDKALTDNGEDLLHGRADTFNPELRAPVNGNGQQAGGRVAKWEIPLAMPSDRATVIKELSGKLIYRVIGKKKKVNLGIKEFKAGAKGTEFEAEINSIGKDEDGNNANMLCLSLSNLPEEVGEIRFYDEKDVRLPVQPAGWSDTNNNTSRTYNFVKNGELPAKGRIEIEIYDDLRTLEAPFKLENVPLVGKPAKEHA